MNMILRATLLTFTYGDNDQSTCIVESIVEKNQTPVET